MSVKALADLSTWSGGITSEVVAGIARLLVGVSAGNWGVELDGDSVPSGTSPAWVDTVSAGGTITLNGEGQIVYTGAAASQTAFSRLARTTWPSIASGYFNATGLLAYFKVWAFPSSANMNVGLGDGVKFFNMRVDPNIWTVNEPGTTTEKTRNAEFFVKIISNQATLWVKDETTGLFVNKLSGAALNSVAADFLSIGDSSGSLVVLGLLDFLNAKTGTQNAPYDDTSPTRSLPSPLAIGQVIDQWPITEDNDPGSSIDWDYEVDGGGLVTGQTNAQVASFMINRNVTTLNQLIANQNSDGLGTPRFSLNGGVIAGFNADGGLASPIHKGVIHA